MMTAYSQQSVENSQGVRVLRPELRHEQITFRGRLLSEVERKKILKALRTLHVLEIMAVNIYRYQITCEESELNRELITAMCNEMTHVQDFYTKLCEYGMRPSPFRWAGWIAGSVIGFGSRLSGPETILKTGMWVEHKMVARYVELLKAAHWDDATRSVIEKDASDEDRHIQNWCRLLLKTQGPA